eukprot:scaffold159593_cov32-Tisochrysis_lutea.AAC.3
MTRAVEENERADELMKVQAVIDRQDAPHRRHAHPRAQVAEHGQEYEVAEQVQAPTVTLGKGVHSTGYTKADVQGQEPSLNDDQPLLVARTKGVISGREVGVDAGPAQQHEAPVEVGGGSIQHFAVGAGLFVKVHVVACI